MANNSPRQITVPAAQWQLSDAVATARFLTVLAEDHETARDWRGTAFLTFDDVTEEYPFVVPPIHVFLSRLFAAVPHALYFLDPTPESAAVLSWLCAQPGVELVASESGLGMAVYESLSDAVDAMFLAVASFAIEMGDDWFEATVGHMQVSQELVPDPEVLGSRGLGDDMFDRLRAVIKERY